MEADALQQIRDTATQGLRAIPRRGLEVGGLIVGSWEASGSASSCVRIHDCPTVEIAYECGPRFLAGEGDKAKLRETMEALRGSGESVIGWWRSHTLDDSLLLSSEDLLLTQSLFGGAAALVIVVLPKLGETPMAALHVVTASECHTSPPFPLTEGASPSPMPSAAEASAVTATDRKVALRELSEVEGLGPGFVSALEAALPGQSFETPDSVREAPVYWAELSSDEGSEPHFAAPPETPRVDFVRDDAPDVSDERPGAKHSPSNPRRTWQDAVLAVRARLSAPIGKREFFAASLAGVAVVALILLLAGEGLRIPERQAMATGASVNGDRSASGQDNSTTGGGDAAVGSQAASTLQLSARQVNGGLLIEWDRQLDIVRGATGGTLAIEDSGERKEVMLTAADLQAGSVLWFPRSDAVRFELTLLGTQREARGILQAHGLTATSSGAQRKSADGRTAKPPAIGFAPDAGSRPASQGIAGRPSPRGAASGQAGGGWADARASRSLPGDRTPQGSAGASPAQPATATVNGTNVPGANVPSPGRPSPLPVERTGVESERLARQNAEGPACRADLQTLAYYEKRSAFGFLRALRKLPFVPGSAEKPSGVFQAAQAGAADCPEIADAHLLSQPSEVEVIAEIGKDGAVRNAELAGAGGKSYVALRTVESIRKWKFQPATISDEAVVSEVRLRVHWSYPQRPAYAPIDSQ